MVDRYVDDNGVRRLATADELAEINARETAWNNTKPTRQLAEIRSIRNQKLSETDYLATSDNTMSEEMKNFRQSMRDVPQNFDEEQYSELLARDEQGNLTHTVWSKP
jgi:hypothetical protein